MFPKVIRCLDELAAHKIPVRLKGMLLKENVADVDAMARIAEERGFGIVFTPTVTVALDSSRKIQKHALTPSAVCRLVRRNILNAPRRRKRGVNICHVGFDEPLIASDGTVYPCLEMRTPLCNLLHDELAEIWKNSDELSDLRETNWAELPGCSDCQLLAYCPLCPGTHQRAGGSKRSNLFCRTLSAIDKAGLLK